MKFEVRDNLDAFIFTDSSIGISKYTDDCWEMNLLGVIAKYNNPQNSRYENMFIGETTLQLDKPLIGRFLLEGYKRYNANDELEEEVPDTELDPADAPELFRNMEDGVLFRVFEKDSNKDGRRCLEMAVDVQKEDAQDADPQGTDTYWLDVYFTGSYVGWDRFVGPVEQH